MKELWKYYIDDWDNMSDEEIEQTTRLSQRYVEEHVEWIEAVASWEQAGKPRSNQQ